MIDGKKYDDELFDSLLAIACKEVATRQIAEIPDASEINYTFSPEFEKRMDKMIYRQSKTLRRKKSLRYMGRIAAALVIMMAMGFSAIMSVSALRIEVLNTILEFGENYLGFRFGNSDATSPSSIIPYPYYVPEGFKEESRSKIGSTDDVYFVNEEGVIITYGVTLKNESVAINIDNEHSQPHEVIENGTTFTIMDGTASGHTCYVIWETDTHLYMVFGEYTADELLAMAVSTTE